MTPDITLLTAEELQTIRLLASGLSAEDVAARMGWSLYVTCGHQNSAVKKLGLNPIAVGAWLQREGLI